MKLVSLVIGASISLILIAMVLAPIALQGEPDAPWTYDDYQICEAEDVVDGAFEVVDFQGQHYIHAKDVGDGTINGITYHVEKANLRLFLLWGQSNSMYLNYDPDIVNEEFTPLKTRAYFYGIDNGTDYRPIISWKDGNGNVFPEHGQFLPVTSPDGTYLIGNVEAPFCATYCENNENLRPYIINAGVGGWALQNFLPGTKGGENIHKVLDEALDKVDFDHYTISPGAWIMSQGESNAGTAINTYIGYFDEITLDLKDSYDLDYGLIIQTRKGNSLNAANAQEEIVLTHPHVLMGSTASQTFTVENGLLASDNIHYTQLGDDIVGSQTARTWLNYTEPPSADYRGLIGLTVPLLILAVLSTLAVGIIRPRD